MQQTTKYKFNLIETSDTFSSDALNANAEAAERELAALAALEAADKSALQTAINTNKSAADTAIKALNADVHPGAAGQIARIATGTYVGTGTVGSSGPNSLTFPFKPLLVFVTSADEFNYHLMIRPGKNSASNNGANAQVTWDEKSVSWYYDARETVFLTHQCNTKGVTYSYLVVGVGE